MAVSLHAGAGKAIAPIALVSNPGREGTGEMIPLLIAIAVACIAFWKVAVRLLAALALFLVVSGIVMVIQDMHHLGK